VGHGNGDLFVATENNFRITVAVVIDQGVVDAAKTRPGIQSDILNSQNFQKIHNEIRTIARF
jgi:hypothetical protein